MNKLAKQFISFGQISILIIGIFAFGFIIGEMGRVDAASIPGPEGPVGSASLPTQLKNFFFGTPTGPVNAIIQSAVWAGIAYGAITMVGGFFGMDDSKTKAIASSAAAGFGVGRLAWAFPETAKLNPVNWLTKGSISRGLNSWTMGLIAAGIVFYLTYKKTKEYTYEYTCEPWQAPTGGSKCEECNRQGILPCSEYQCRSLGQGCKLVNPGTDEEKCVWVNPKDVNPPVIEPWLEALLEGYKYTPDNTISPPDRGVIIENINSEDKCVDAFTAMTFGMNIVGGGVDNQPESAKCKIDYLNKQKFDDMQYWFGGSQLLRYNHTQIMSLPGKSAYEAENIEINNDGTYSFFVRCQDENGNSNPANFVFKFCVDAGPDTTAPAIITTNLINGMPIANNQTSVDLIVYINEPAECRWDRLDVEYNDSKNLMKCSSSVTEMNAQMLYECTTTLNGLKNSEDNKFYFRCKDQPKKPEVERNTNTESYEFILKGTEPLVLNEIGPNETVRDNTDSVKVTLTAETSAGAEEGKSVCYYNNVSGDNDKYIQFYQTNSNKHSQDLYLSEGFYTYYIKCVDLGGNSDEKMTSFYVESDAEAPVITRAYKEENNLKLITDEKSECVYDVLNCNYLFDDGILLTTLNDINHFVEWDSSKNYYIKCKDEYGNQPSPDSCSIIAKPFEIYKKE